MNRFVLAFVILALAGCSATSSVVTETPVETTVITWADVETLDLSDYEDEPALIDIAVTHDVPPSLLENRVDAGIEHEVSGYRIQIYSTLETDAASAVESETRRWLNRNAFPGQGVPSVYNEFRQPYYRIRVGDYVTRLDAEDALVRISERFRRAMIVPDIVTVRN